MVHPIAGDSRQEFQWMKFVQDQWQKQANTAETRKHNGGNGEPRQMTRLRPNQRVDLNTS